MTKVQPHPHSHFLPASLCLSQLAKLIDSFATQMVSKGKELNEFRAKHNIRLVNEEKMSRESEGAGKSGSAGVLVSE
eukprot:gi/632949568/ref/XP_007890227.1/ PREDICTED: prefoldin subunit 2-like [Callorhinchus milii]